MPIETPVVGFVRTFPVNPTFSVDGKPAPYENVYVEISDPSLATVEWDGLVRVTPLGPTGTATLTVRIDVKLGGGEVLVYATKELAFVNAVVLDLGDGALEPVP